MEVSLTAHTGIHYHYMTYLTLCVLCGSEYWQEQTGLTYDERYDAYEEAHQAHVVDCLKRGQKPEPKVRKRAGYHAIDATKSVAKQMADLDELREQGYVRQSPRGMISNGRGREEMVAWATDVIELVKSKTLVCYQSALVNALGVSLASLGMPQVPYPRDQHDPGARASFKEIQKMLHDFELRKDGVEFGEVTQVFTQTSGVYLLSAYVTHSEDADFEYAELIPHYVVYNAGTRVLFLNPEVVVVTDSDMEDIDTFMSRLRQAPYFVRIPSRDSRGNIRRLWVPRARAARYPYNAPDLL